MAKAKAKVKAHFTHQGKQYKPGDEFEGEEHEIANLAQQGHLEHPPTQQTQQGGPPHPQGQSPDPTKQQGH